MTDDDDRRLRELGAVVEASSQLEMQLRRAFCAMLGSKYAAIVGAGQQTIWLIDNCRAVLKAHREIDEAHRASVDAALVACRDANNKRRQLVHDVWGHGPEGAMMLLGSRYRDHKLKVSGPETISTIAATRDALRNCAHQLNAEVEAAFGSDAATIEAQLRWEEYVATLPAADVEGMVRRRAKTAGLRDQEIDAVVRRWTSQQS
jgi:hypothetical protein